MFNSKDVNPDRHSGMFVLNALAASEDISHIFNKHPKGHVHSVFNSSFNLAFGDHLVHIGAIENGVAPFGIGLEQINASLLTKLLAVNLEVFWDEYSASLIFPKGISLSLEQVKLTNHKMQPFHYRTMHLEGNLGLLQDKLLQADWQTGLAETEAEKKRVIHHLLHSPSSAEDDAVLNKLDSLKNLACNCEDEDAEKVFDYWIGRGLGLTPTGDDVITGICAVLSALEGTDQTFIQQLKSYMTERGKERTTHIALEYLQYATENKFHSHLLHVCTVLDNPNGVEFTKALEEMKGIGHTSGADTLVGVLIGIKAAVIHRKKGDCY